MDQFPVKALPNTDITNFQKNEAEREWSGPFTFISGADTQFGMIDQYHLKRTEPNWDKEIKLTRESIERINKMSPLPRFYVICGDMLDAFPYEGLHNKNCINSICSFIFIQELIKRISVKSNMKILQKCLKN
jgi:hypothetical protein